MHVYFELVNASKHNHCSATSIDGSRGGGGGNPTMASSWNRVQGWTVLTYFVTVSVQIGVRSAVSG